MTSKTLYKGFFKKIKIAVRTNFDSDAKYQIKSYFYYVS